ncbi:DMT family transporter [Patescibacteria group bacterium]|nr:DMT family transporter [Patescibacteria group bacterium]MBU1683760.1 DMT family transporter [Patescibacteria group bacterium]
MRLFRTKDQERIGEMYVMISVLLHAGFPILINYATHFVPAIFYAGISAIVTAIMMFAILVYQKDLKEIFVKKAWFPISMVVIFVVVVPLALIYSGTKMTSGINTSILLQAEIIFTLLFTWIAGEKITQRRLFGGLAVLCGTILVIYNGALKLNVGDLLIVAATAFYPIGNIYAKKALKLVSPITILFLRSLFGGMALILISLWLDGIIIGGIDLIQIMRDYWFIILLNGLLISGITKIIWYKGLKRLDLSKAIIMVMTFPAFSIILAGAFLKEIPTLYQVGGLVIIFAGLYSVMKHKAIPVGSIDGK